MEPTHGRRPTLDENDPRQVNIQDLASKLIQIMQPSNEVGRQDHGMRKLTSLISEGAFFGYDLFTQPSEWTFDWFWSRDGRAHEIVFFPALFKITDDHGRFLSMPELKVPIILADGTSA